MNVNIRIAKELVKLARRLIASNQIEEAKKSGALKSVETWIKKTGKGDDSDSDMLAKVCFDSNGYKGVVCAFCHLNSEELEEIGKNGVVGKWEKILCDFFDKSSDKYSNGSNDALGNKICHLKDEIA